MLINAIYSSIPNRDLMSVRILVNEPTIDFKLLRGLSTRTGMSTAMPNSGPDGIGTFRHYFHFIPL